MKLTLDVVESMLDQLSLGPVREPDVIHVFHESRISLTSLLESDFVMASHYHADPEVFAHCAERKV